MKKEDRRENGNNVYSHSRLWLYESCPEAFKVKYIDKIFPEVPKSMSLFLGSVVHESLEWLYKEVGFGRKIEIDDLIQDFAVRWKKQFSEDVRVTNGSAEENFNKGIKFLANYYQKNFPFKENTIEIEKKILFPLDKDGMYKIQGFIDRIVKTGEHEYEVHDYKTNEFMKRQEQVDKDRQLAFYHLGLQELFGKQITVSLIWHFLAHNKTIRSRRTQEQLERLKEETLELIKKIESTTTWNACNKPWCDWCSYKRLNNLDYSTHKIARMKNGNKDLNKFFGKT